MHDKSKSLSEVITEALERSKRTGMEVCTSCGVDMGYPISVPADSVIRMRGGAIYGAGGQTCGPCAKRIWKGLPDCS